jgi:hypothetical protein
MLLLRSVIRRGGRSVTLALLAFAAVGLLTVPRAAGAPEDVTVDIVIAGTLGTNNWYTSSVTVNWVVTGAANSSGCDAKTLTADTTGTTLTCTASDLNGTTVIRSRTFKIDKTPPTAAPAASRAADANGWYNHALTVTFSGTDGTSGIAACSTKTYSGPDNASATVSGSCTDNAGNVGASSLPLKYDATPPVTVAAASRAADANGWYNHALTVSFAGSDVTSGIASCSSAGYSGPDSGSAAVGGSCTDKAGNVGASSLPLKYDATAPVTAASASRAADAKGWYNHPLTVSFAGSDVTSGIAGCSSASYSGPDNASASVAGSCTDKAGNVGAASQPLKYDSTPPTVSRLAAAPGNRRFELKWSNSADTENVQVARSPGRGRTQTSTIYSGRAKSCRDAGLSVGKAYRYTVTGFDQAGNADSATVTVTATGPLLSPPPGARVTSPPVLTWTPVAHASYYNLQIVRGRKILSVWPRRAYFRLPRSWSFDGHRYQLEDGVYHWYVWPGFGRLSVAKYGNRLGGSTFVVGHHTRAAR